MSALTQPHTDSRSPVRAAAPLLAVSVLANLAVFIVGTVLGADFTIAIDGAGTLTTAGAVEVIAASLLPLTLAIGAYVVLVPRSQLVRRVWTPVVAVLALASLGGPTGATDLTTALALGTMHLVVGALAAFGIPIRVGH